MTIYKSVPEMLKSMGVSEDSIAEVERKGTEKAVETLAKMVKRLEEERDRYKARFRKTRSKLSGMEASKKDEWDFIKMKGLDEEFHVFRKQRLDDIIDFF